MTPSGFLLINKPPRITSHDVVDTLRKITGIKKIGHAGTLDPFATGLLILAISRQATKEISSFVGLPKTYEATFTLGATTETLDPESKITYAESPPSLSETNIKTAMGAMTGPQDQIPPMYAAIKVNGKKLYELARQGKTIERKPRQITITDFKLRNINQGDQTTTIDVSISCSSGTYIRCIARDLAKHLNTLGYCSSLNRSTIGTYTIQNAANLRDVTKDNWQSLLIQKSH